MGIEGNHSELEAVGAQSQIPECIKHYILKYCNIIRGWRTFSLCVCGILFCLTILHAGLVRTITTTLCLEKKLGIHCCPIVHHLVLLQLPAQRWLLYFPVGELTQAKACVRAGSLRPWGTCYSFSLVSSTPLCVLLFILPHYSFLSSLPYLFIFSLSPSSFTTL